jgi:uncharacterized protein (UPF0332 family)
LIAQNRNRFNNSTIQQKIDSEFTIIKIALLLLDGFSTSKHRQLIGYFNKEYINTGKIPVDIGEILNES